MKMYLLYLATSVLCFALSPSFAQNHADVTLHPYSLPNTQVRRLHSEIVQIDYVLYVSLPKNYAASSKIYPVVITLDADYSFALAHNIIAHFVDRGNLPEMLIVSIAYEGASQHVPVYRRNRTRDYTPTHTLEGGYGPAFQKYSGGGEKFRTFIAQELFPFLEANYRVKPDDRIFVGHSFGGLFGSFVLLTQPGMFQRYILVSPSLWYDEKAIFKFERDYAARSKDLAVRVFFGVGSHENQPLNSRAMVDDINNLIEMLRSRGYPGLDISSHIFENETHNSVFPAALPRGLRIVFSDH